MSASLLAIARGRCRPISYLLAPPADPQDRIGWVGGRPPASIDGYAAGDAQFVFSVTTWPSRQISAYLRGDAADLEQDWSGSVRALTIVAHDRSEMTQGVAQSPHAGIWLQSERDDAMTERGTVICPYPFSKLGGKPELGGAPPRVLREVGALAATHRLLLQFTMPMRSRGDSGPKGNWPFWDGTLLLFIREARAADGPTDADDCTYVYWR